jgi:hypothetical protein
MVAGPDANRFALRGADAPQAIFLGVAEGLGVRSPARLGKIVCNSRGLDIDFPTRTVKYSPPALPRIYKHLKIKEFFDEKSRSKSE